MSESLIQFQFGGPGVTDPPEMTAADGSWSDLQPELIVTISRSLSTVADYTRLRSVCSSWRSAASPNPRHLPIQPPSIALPSRQQSDGHQSVKIITFPHSNTHFLPLLSNSDHPQFLGSSDGLLVLRSSCGSISLFNPLTLSHTRLPSLKTFPMSPFFIRKIVLSPSRPPAGPAVAVAVLSCPNLIALCRPAVDDADSSWTHIQGSSDYQDAIFFKGRFFIADCFRRIFVLDDDTGELTEVARVLIARAPPFIGRCEKCYLAESDGNLLLVVRHFIRVGMRGQRDAVVTKGFDVFRLVKMGDSCGGKSIWLELKSLGDVILFLGLNRSIALSGDECPCFRMNCIYFLDDTLNSVGDLAQSAGDAGVFDMIDGSIEPLRYGLGDSPSGHDHRQPAVWFTPSLC